MGFVAVPSVWKTRKAAFVLRGPLLSFSKLRTPLLDYCPYCALVFSIFVGKSRLWASLPCRRFGKREKWGGAVGGKKIETSGMRYNRQILMPQVLKFGDKRLNLRRY